MTSIFTTCPCQKPYFFCDPGSNLCQPCSSVCSGGFEKFCTTYCSDYHKTSLDSHPTTSSFKPPRQPFGFINITPTHPTDTKLPSKTSDTSESGGLAISHQESTVGYKEFSSDFGLLVTLTISLTILVLFIILVLVYVLSCKNYRTRRKKQNNECQNSLIESGSQQKIVVPCLASTLNRSTIPTKSANEKTECNKCRNNCSDSSPKKQYPNTSSDPALFDEKQSFVKDPNESRPSRQTQSTCVLHANVLRIKTDVSMNVGSNP